MHVQAILEGKGTGVVTIGPQSTTAEAARLLTQNRIGAVVVLAESGEVAGILSERDIVRGFAAHGSSVADLPVSELMSRDVLTCHPSDTIDELMAVMTRRRVRHLPVVEDGALLGIISIGDVVKHRLDEAALEVDSLRQYVLAGR
jgi:CBS domain-containing protein